MNRSTIWALFCLFLITSPSAISGQSASPQSVNKKCPTVDVKGPRKSKALKTVSYAAQIKHFPTGAQPIFRWSITGAYILEGRDSQMITVRALAREVRATLVIENFPSGCRLNRDSIVTEITEIPYVHPPPVISAIYTSPSLITRPCPPGSRSDTCAPSFNEVELTAEALVNAPDGHFDKLLYRWFVTAGRLKGEGKTVIWDLSGVGSGTYTVTVEVEYFDLKASGTATVKVADCRDCKATIE